MTSPQPQPEPLPPWTFTGILFVFLAVALELLGSILGDSPSTAYPGWLVPTAWPTGLRVAWWLAAAIAAGRAGAGAVGQRRPTLVRILVGAIIAAPFAVFAAGVGTGASWATWH